MDRIPFISWDFQGIDGEDRALLGSSRINDDLAAQGAVLKEGMPVLLWEADEDQSGNPALMIVDAIAHFDPVTNRWVAEVNRDSFRYEPPRDPPWSTP